MTLTASPPPGATWTEAEGLEYLETPDWVLPKMPNCTYDFELGGYVDGCQVSGSRANAISGDGRRIAGHVDAGGWKGAAWVYGEITIMGRDDPKGWIGSVNTISNDGRSQMVGFPGALLSHVKLGAEPGPCEADCPIEP
jgi:hypothetical protein